MDIGSVPEGTPITPPKCTLISGRQPAGPGLGKGAPVFKPLHLLMDGQFVSLHFLPQKRTERRWHRRFLPGRESQFAPLLPKKLGLHSLLPFQGAGVRWDEAVTAQGHREQRNHTVQRVSTDHGCLGPLLASHVTQTASSSPVPPGAGSWEWVVLCCTWEGCGEDPGSTRVCFIKRFSLSPHSRTHFERASHVISDATGTYTCITATGSSCSPQICVTLSVRLGP